VVCAVSLVGQWADEAAQRTNGSLRILQYHGSGRYKYTAQQLARDYDGEALRLRELRVVMLCLRRYRGSLDSSCCSANAYLPVDASC
jgi:hypothetical protein